MASTKPNDNSCFISFSFPRAVRDAFLRHEAMQKGAEGRHSPFCAFGAALKAPIHVAGEGAPWLRLLAWSLFSSTV
jgi:hypothetical protein